MQSLNRLDTPIHFLYRKNSPTKGDIGIELELEGQLAPLGEPYWICHDEGSLRGGIEYVLRKPITLKDLPRALEDLEAALKGSKPKNSIRCSTHIHVNVSNLTARQIYQGLLCYYLFEPLLIRTQPEKRWGNLFCLDMEHAQDSFGELHKDISLPDTPFRRFNRDAHRYAACNLVAVQKFGSVEFRFLDAITDTSLLHAWCNTLHRLIHTAAFVPPLQLLKLYDELPVKEFLKHFLGQAGFSLISQQRHTSESLNSLIHTNYDYVFELAHVLNSRKFEMPQEYWDEDRAESSAPSVYEHAFDQVFQGMSNNIWTQMTQMVQPAQQPAHPISATPASNPWGSIPVPAEDVPYLDDFGEPFSDEVE